EPTFHRVGRSPPEQANMQKERGVRRSWPLELADFRTSRQPLSLNHYLRIKTAPPHPIRAGRRARPAAHCDRPWCNTCPRAPGPNRPTDLPALTHTHKHPSALRHARNDGNAPGGGKDHAHNAGNVLAGNGG